MGKRWESMEYLFLSFVFYLSNCGEGCRWYPISLLISRVLSSSMCTLQKWIYISPFLQELHAKLGYTRCDPRRHIASFCLKDWWIRDWMYWTSPALNQTKKNKNKNSFCLKVCNFLNHTLETIPQATKCKIWHIHQRTISQAQHLWMIFQNLLCIFWF